MVHSRVKSNGWVKNEKVLYTQLNIIDINQSTSVDKTGETSAGGGGVTGEIDWTSGSSAQFQSGSVLDIQAGADGYVDGYVTTRTGGTINSGAPGSIVLAGGSSDWIKFSPSRSKTYNYSMYMVGRAMSQGVSSTAVLNFGGASGAAVVQTVPLNSGTPAFICSVPSHDNATLASISVYFQVGTNWANVPAAFPQIYGFLLPYNYNTSGAPIIGLNSSVVLYPSEVLATWNNAATKVLTFPVTQFAVMNNATYMLQLSLADSIPAAGDSNNRTTSWISIQCNYTTINDSRFPG